MFGFRSSNPVLGSAFSQVGQVAQAERMTVQGTVNKTLLLLVLVAGSAFYTWGQLASGNAAGLGAWIIVGVIVGLVTGLAISFKQTLAPALSPVYAIAQGLALGGISGMMEAQYPGIVLQAISLTFGTLGAMLLAYKFRLIEVTDQFRFVLMSAMGGIFVVYLLSFVLGFFGIQIPFLGNGLFGIGFSVFVVAIAALSLALDFDMIEKGAKHGAPRYMEWYGAFALMVTLIWLYLEILRLLAKLRDRR